MSNNIEELSGSNKDRQEFEKWADALSHMDDLSVSRELFNRIMNHSDLNDDDKALLSDAYQYCQKLLKYGKPLEPDLLRIYLQDLKGYEISQINMVNLIIMLGCCGIVFTE